MEIVDAQAMDIVEDYLENECIEGTADKRWQILQGYSCIKIRRFVNRVKDVGPQLNIYANIDNPEPCRITIHITEKHWRLDMADPDFFANLSNTIDHALKMEHAALLIAK